MKNLVLVALNIRSTHNVGSMFRTCDGFDASMILVGITPRPISNNDNRLPHIAKKANSAISKTALGAENSVEWKYFTDLASTLEYLRLQKYSVFAIEQAKKSKNIRNLQAKGKVALIVGPEVDGIDKSDLKYFDELYEIPMKGSKESFNVSIAAAIALYQATKN